MSARKYNRCVYLGLPAFNEEFAIAPLFERIRVARAELLRCGVLSDLKVIFYDDGSTDETAVQVREQARDLEVLLLSPGKNGGLGVALRGLFTQFIDEASEEDVLVIMDTDDTHDPSQIHELLRQMDEQTHDVVIASRYRRGSQISGVSVLRQILSLGFGCLMKIVLPIRGVRDYSCGYRAYTYASLSLAASRSGFLLQESGFSSMPEVLIRLREHSLSFGEIPLKLSYHRRLTVSKMQAWQNTRRLLSRMWTWRVFPQRMTRSPFAGPDTRTWWAVEHLRRDPLN